jgi:hypothetical protein
MREPIDVDETGEASGNAIRKLYGEGREQEIKLPPPEAMHGAADAFPGSDFPDAMPLERSSEMQHVAGAVLRRGRAQAESYGAALVVIAIDREPKQGVELEALPTPGYAFGVASTSDDDETIALALRGIATRLERA